MASEQQLERSITDLAGKMDKLSGIMERNPAREYSYTESRVGTDITRTSFEKWQFNNIPIVNNVTILANLIHSTDIDPFGHILSFRATNLSGVPSSSFWLIEQSNNLQVWEPNYCSAVIVPETLVGTQQSFNPATGAVLNWNVSTLQYTLWSKMRYLRLSRLATYAGTVIAKPTVAISVNDCSSLAVTSFGQ